MRRITLCAELTEWPYKWKQKKKKEKKKLSQAIKSTAPFYHQRLNGSGEQQSIITASPCAPAKPVFSTARRHAAAAAAAADK